MYNDTLVISGNHINIEDVCRVSKRDVKLELSSDQNFFNRINDGYKFLEELLAREGKIYGVTTGYGDSVNRGVPIDLVDQLPVNLTRFHGCGLGQNFNIEEGRAILATRMVSLARGYSGVRYELLQQLETLLEHDIVPVIPQEGSVGASGDLTPLSYVAAALIGERNVYYKGEVRATKDVYKELGIAPLVLKPKEGLAIMNGTAVMTAIACLIYKRAEYLVDLCTRTTSFVSLAMKGNKDHFDDHLFAAKPHLGSQRVAHDIRLDLAKLPDEKQPIILQDRYSIRCAPHIIGVLADALPHFRQIIENELNSANDNPLIDPVRKKLLHGGHFYGGHIAYAMDSMKVLIANLADLMDRQMALLVDVKFNNGLTSNLSLPDSNRVSLNHGFKAVQIGVSAWTAEAMKNCMPASVFSRSTECHNQDKVSMGTIAARDCLRVLQLTEQVQAAHLLACVQAIVVREHVEGKKMHLGRDAGEFLDAVLAEFQPVTEDRPLEGDLRRFVDYIQQQHFDLNWHEPQKQAAKAAEDLALSDV